MSLKPSIVSCLMTVFLLVSLGVEADELKRAEHLADKNPVNLIFEDKIKANAPANQAVINNTSLSQLTAHRWKLSVMRGVSESGLNADATVFEFAKDFNFKVSLPCSYIYGKYQAEDSGQFLLRKLDFKNRACESGKEQEALLKTSLLSADEFFINDRTLILGMQGQSILGFVETDKSIDMTGLESKSSKKHKSKNSNKSKTKSKTKTAAEPKAGSKQKALRTKTGAKTPKASAIAGATKKSKVKAKH